MEPARVVVHALHWRHVRHWYLVADVDQGRTRGTGRLETGRSNYGAPRFRRSRVG
jgi:hypothetical protein